MIVEGCTGFYGLGDGTLTAVRDQNDILGPMLSDCISDCPAPDPSGLYP